MTSRSFQVDLRGVVDLLGRHLYSGPRVYVRELLQNALDAVTARRAIDPSAPARIDVRTGDGVVTVTDDGIGLTEAEVHELLATIGASAKRDELGLARGDFLGQFGIGLLSGFLVADEIVVRTRSHTGAPAVRWTGRADGTYTVEADDRDTAGTTVTVAARPSERRWTEPETVVELATSFGALLPVPVEVDGRRVNAEAPPWAHDGREPGRRRADLIGLAQDVLGFTPLDMVELAVPEAGLTGIAYVLPFPANPADPGGHRVYLRGMLLTENARALLPDWAFFARCVVDARELRPTADREGLYDDDLLETTREALGRALRGWVVGVARRDPDRLARFLAAHHLGVKALALHDDAMLELVEHWWPLETTEGPMTIAAFRARHEVVRYTATVEEFRQLSAVAAAQGLALLNGGYTYDAELLERLGALREGLRVERMDPGLLPARLAAVDPAVELAARPFLVAARRAAEPLGCEVLLRAFDPPSLPVLYLVDRGAAHARETRRVREHADELWAGVLGALEPAAEERPRLVLNHRSPLVRRLCTVTDGAAATLAVEALYGQALLLGHHPLSPADTAVLDRTLSALLERAVPELTEER